MLRHINRWHGFNDDQKRKIVLLRTVYDIPVKEIAARFSVSTGTIGRVLRESGVVCVRPRRRALKGAT